MSDIPSTWQDPRLSSALELHRILDQALIALVATDHPLRYTQDVVLGEVHQDVCMRVADLKNADLSAVTCDYRQWLTAAGASAQATQSGRRPTR